MSRSPQFRDRPLMKLMFCFSAPLCLTVYILACLRFNFSSHHHSDFSYPSECLFFSSFLLNLLCCKRRVLVPPLPVRSWTSPQAAVQSLRPLYYPRDWRIMPPRELLFWNVWICIAVQRAPLWKRNTLLFHSWIWIFFFPATHHGRSIRCNHQVSDAHSSCL